MTTVFEQGLLIFHDVLALRLMEEKQMTMEALKSRHANLE
jgi:6-phospho-3-hexuloisomerase